MPRAESKPRQTRKISESKSAFQRLIVQWFDEHGLDYPWRRTRDPYAILVSELMLQQTQVATVLSKRYFERWLEQFPTPAALAAATEEAVLKAWEGLGYYRRARNLQKAAASIEADHSGVFPKDIEQIRELPGVGRYTGGAVATFAFGHSEPIVDANIARVLARLFDCDEAIDSPAGQAKLWDWAGELVPKKNARSYNSGLMELGQQICTNRSPQCTECPVSQFCQTRNPELLPVKKPRVKTVKVDEHVVFAEHSKRGILLEQETGRRREGLWKLPETTKLGPILLTMPYSITHYRVTLIVHQAQDLPETKGTHQRWVPHDELDSIAMPSPYRKALQRLTEGLL